ncbi:hypothetical protein C4588_01055 [Candidatus Parcubacteria bacterium]|nr:MAG: hypothetical protein C4588_01055 [Candidatus Parcubacteria bacterium]
MPATPLKIIQFESDVFQVTYQGATIGIGQTQGEAMSIAYNYANRQQITPFVVTVEDLPKNGLLRNSTKH